MTTGAKCPLVRDAVTNCHSSEEAETDMNKLTPGTCQIPTIKVMARFHSKDQEFASGFL